MMDIWKNRENLLLYNLFGMVIFQIIMINITVELIEFMRRKEDGDEIDRKQFVHRSASVITVLLIAGIGMTIYDLPLWIVVLADACLLGVLAYNPGGLNVIMSVLNAALILVFGMMAVYVPGYISKKLTYYTLFNAIVVCFIEYAAVNIAARSSLHMLNRYEVSLMTLDIVISAVIVRLLMELDNVAYRYIGIVCVLLACYMFFGLVHKIKKAQQTEKERLEIIKDYELQKQYLNSVNILDEHTRKLRHDIKNHLSTISILLEDEADGQKRAKEYIEQYMEHAVLSQNIVRTNNKVVNAVINSKLLYATEHDINVSVSIDKNVGRLSDIELCSIIGNLFDNAIEAEVKNKPEDREIKINIHMEGDILDIFFMNKTDMPVLEINPELHSSKDSGLEHGFGIANIKAIVNKHDGEIDTYDKDEYFCFDIRI